MHLTFCAPPKRFQELYDEVWKQGKAFIGSYEGVPVLEEFVTRLAHRNVILVRDEYRRIWEHIQSRRTAALDAGRREQEGLVINGQSGIGRSPAAVSLPVRHQRPYFWSDVQANLCSCIMPSLLLFGRVSPSCSANTESSATSSTRPGSRDSGSAMESRSTCRNTHCTWSTAAWTSLHLQASCWIEPASSSPQVPPYTTRAGNWGILRAALRFG